MRRVKRVGDGIHISDNTNLFDFVLSVEVCEFSQGGEPEAKRRNTFSRHECQDQAEATHGIHFQFTKLTVDQLSAFSEKVKKAFEGETAFDDGCDARAYLISYYASHHGIFGGKIFIQKNIKAVMSPRTHEALTWYHHVATVLMDTDENAYVIDPFFREPLIALDHWAEQLSPVIGARVSRGKLHYRGPRGTLALTAPFFWDYPAEMSNSLIDQTTRFERDDLKKAIRAYPKAAQVFGIQ